MDDEIQHLRKTNTVLKISLVMLGVLVLLGVIQAVTAGTVGVGALSVNLRDDRAQAAPTTSSESPSGQGGLNGALDTTTATSSETPTSPSAETKVLEGSFKQSRGLLTVEVTKVENQGGRVKLYITAVNASTAKMDLPLGPFKAVDDTKREYGASLATSKWPVSVAKGSSITGTVELDQPVGKAATKVDIAFNGIAGSLAPTGGAVAVPGIEIPR
ncbi:hypothetical protein ACFFQW_38200 [Umezawaea endophytica]|uniref:DUF4352 domain-containing protein n=1 Tax=Umezawaea endophytica TaxID=1654476 RepID=A0A9X2VXF4_9PSEU|nr:hypothetical protein [Umezawaea endophytica]MCS7484460.1 hypothetical protein [Umezawaea endophytica]